MADENVTVIKTIAGIEITYDKRTEKFMATIEGKRVAYKDIRAVEKRIEAEQSPIRAMELSFGRPATLVDVTNQAAGRLQGYVVGARSWNGTRWKHTYYGLSRYDAEIEAKINDIAERYEALREEFRAVLADTRALTVQEVRDRGKAKPEGKDGR